MSGIDWSRGRVNCGYTPQSHPKDRPKEQDEPTDIQLQCPSQSVPPAKLNARRHPSVERAAKSPHALGHSDVNSSPARASSSQSTIYDRLIRSEPSRPTEPPSHVCHNHIPNRLAQSSYTP